MNCDGLVTVTDVGLWFKWLFFYPGDLALYGIMDTAAGTFLELSAASYGGLLSFLISVILWVVVIAVIAELFGSEKRTQSPLAEKQS